MPAVGLWILRALAPIGFFKLGDWFGEDGDNINLMTIVLVVVGLIGGILIGRKLKK